VLSGLRESYPDITFMTVDWDTYRRHAVTTTRRIPRRSTLLLIKSGKEVDRIVAGTSRRRIQSMLDKAASPGE